MGDVMPEQNELRGRLFPHYYSTYCQHGLHETCRLFCKTCKSDCLCRCHDGQRRGAVQRKLSVEEALRKAGG